MAAGDHQPVFESIAHGLRDEGVTVSQMMGHPCLKAANGKIAVTYWHDSLLVKLPPADVEAWLDEPDVGYFEPQKGRFMKNWLVIPPRYVDEWEKLTVASLKNVAEADAIREQPVSAVRFRLGPQA
ncbi:hypothetical protein EXS54_01245 [Patescibacteria group bacterium]|nr:hypothetical protein [Patescibacteria group bacterium]